MRAIGVIIILMLMMVGWVILSTTKGEKASGKELMWASAIYFICFIPFIIYFLSGESTIPYLPVFGIFYFIYYGLSIFNRYTFFSTEYMDPITVNQCLQLSFLGFVSLLLAFYTPLGGFVNPMVKPLRINWDSDKAFRLGTILGIIGIFVNFINPTPLGSQLRLRLGAVVEVFGLFLNLGIAVLFMLQLQHKLSLRGRVILWLVFFTPRLLFDLGSGASSTVLLDFVLLFFIYFYYNKKIPLLQTTLALLFFFVVFAARDDFRAATWYGGEYGKSTQFRKGTFYVQLIYEKLTQSEKTEYLSSAYERLAGRTDSLVTFGKVIELTPRYIPFWNGYTYATLWTSLIPRFLYPTKPEKTIGQEFGKRYMFLAPDDMSTSYNLPVLIEMYINFGDIGVIVGMFLIGLIFRICYALLNHKDAGEGGFIISVLIFNSLLLLESNFSLIFGGLIQTIILFYLIIRRMRLTVQQTKV